MTLPDFIHEAVLRQALKTPENPAVRFEGESHTYRSVVGSALLFARTLLGQFTLTRRLVAVLGNKTPETISTLLGTLYAGCAYLPLDPRSPRLRLQAILESARPDCLVYSEPRAELARAISFPGLSCTVMPEPAPAAELLTPTVPVRPADLAYLLFTSGSTGEPKGVPISHGNAAAFVGWASQKFDLTERDRIAVHAPLHFDLPVFDLYVGLRKGSCLVLVPEERVIFPEATSRLLNDEEATVLYAVPSALLSILKRCGRSEQPLGPLRYLLYAGEEFPAAHLEGLRRALPHARIFNLYGPVETNVVTCYEIEELPLERVPIGKPVEGTEVEVLSVDGTKVKEVGRRGELIVHGPSVFSGYWRRDDLPERSMWADEKGKVWYRTGDIGCWREDGQLQFLGRRDSMIKTRGFRVELGEIEATLQRHPRVAQAAVIATPDADLTNSIHAFVAPASDSPLPSETEILQWCRTYLPNYMIPAQVRFMKELPTGSNGKVDRRLLAGLAERSSR